MYVLCVWIGDWQWLDLENVPGPLDWIAFVLGGLGIGFTIWQLMRSKGALRAAADALDETRGTLMRNQLIGVLPGLEEVSDGLDAAMVSDNRDAAAAALKLFVLRSAEVVALLQSTSSAHSETISELEAAGVLALEARAGLYGPPGETTHQIAQAAATRIRGAGPQIRALSVLIKNDAHPVVQNGRRSGLKGGA